MSEIDLDHLERVAWEATPGPWERGSAACVYAVQDDDGLPPFAIAEAGRSADRTHIAAFDPQTVLALIARLRAAEARADDAERRGWIAGRDAAAECICDNDAWPEPMSGRIRALTPPQEPSTNG